jgi:sugar/nucleoside kinase (ribokinase family)
LVIVTRGAESAYFDCAATRGEVRTFPVEAVDTLGAGDAFVAGLLSQILEYQTLDEVLSEPVLRAIIRFANGCGALATQKPGAIPALPTREKVDNFLKSAS